MSRHRFGSNPHDGGLDLQRIDDLQPALRRLEVLLSTERYDAAIGVIEELRWAAPSIPDLASSLADCGVDQRSLNKLESAGLVTVAQLANCPTLNLMSIRLMKFKSVTRVLQQVISACAPVGCPRRGCGLPEFVKDDELRRHFARCELHALGCLTDAELSSVRCYATDLEIIAVLQAAIHVAAASGGRK